MTKIYHPLLSVIASATDREVAKYCEYLKVENKILRARIPGQVHTNREERERLRKYGKALGRAIEERRSRHVDCGTCTCSCLLNGQHLHAFVGGAGLRPETRMTTHQ